jgi:hypothetical protein
LIFGHSVFEVSDFSEIELVFPWDGNYTRAAEMETELPHLQCEHTK